jgi:sensor histidine kinase regulating citrate/malate metabolism
VPSPLFATEPKMHRSEWSSMLLNLLTNSIKAVKRAQRPGRFLIRVGAGGPGFVFLEFTDNGDGIPKENWERVFVSSVIKTHSCVNLTNCSNQSPEIAGRL